MTDRMMDKPKNPRRAAAPMGKGAKYKGWYLVETGHRFYHACRGSLRICVGPLRRGDKEELRKRFRAIVDEFMEGAK